MHPRVLVVEDIPALRRSFALALERGGCTAFQSSHLDEALEIACFDVPDVIVVDERVVFGEEDAFRRLRDDPRLSGVQVVALSAGVQRRHALIARGVHGVVGKPVRGDELLGAVRWVLEVYRRPRIARDPS
jgi:chemotaxis family two-component system sensor histidine kinase/response regulator PixL